MNRHISQKLTDGLNFGEDGQVTQPPSKTESQIDKQLNVNTVTGLTSTQFESQTGYSLNSQSQTQTQLSQQQLIERTHSHSKQLKNNNNNNKISKDFATNNNNNSNKNGISNIYMISLFFVEVFIV